MNNQNMTIHNEIPKLGDLVHPFYIHDCKRNFSYCLKHTWHNDNEIQPQLGVFTLVVAAWDRLPWMELLFTLVSYPMQPSNIWFSLNGTREYLLFNLNRSSWIEFEKGNQEGWLTSSEAREKCQWHNWFNYLAKGEIVLHHCIHFQAPFVHIFPSYSCVEQCS